MTSPGTLCVVSNAWTAETDQFVVYRQRCLQKKTDCIWFLKKLRYIYSLNLIRLFNKLFAQQIVNGGQDTERDVSLKESTSLAGSTHNTGIAEIALPQSFKQRNEAATASLVAKMKSVDHLAQRRQGGGGYYQRFQIHDHSQANTFVSSTATFLGSDDTEEDPRDFSMTSGVLGSNGGALVPVSSRDSQSRKKHKSSDDIALEKYKKVSRHDHNPDCMLISSRSNSIFDGDKKAFFSIIVILRDKI